MTDIGRIVDEEVRFWQASGSADKPKLLIALTQLRDAFQAPEQLAEQLEKLRCELNYPAKRFESFVSSIVSVASQALRHENPPARDSKTLKESMKRCEGWLDICRDFSVAGAAVSVLEVHSGELASALDWVLTAEQTARLVDLSPTAIENFQTLFSDKIAALVLPSVRKQLSSKELLRNRMRWTSVSGNLVEKLKKETVTERKRLCTEMFELVNSWSGGPGSSGSGDVVRQVATLDSRKADLEMMGKVATVCRDADANGELAALLKKLRTEIKGERERVATVWQEETVRKFEIAKSQFSVKLSAAGKLEVAFPRDLLSVSRQVRFLEAVGISIDKKLANLLQSNTALLLNAAELTRLASLYNHFGVVLPEILRPVVAREAAALETGLKELVRSQTDAGGTITRLKQGLHKLRKSIDFLSETQKAVETQLLVLIDAWDLSDALVWNSAVAKLQGLVQAALDRTGASVGDAQAWLQWVDGQLQKLVQVAVGERKFLRTTETLRVFVTVVKDSQVVLEPSLLSLEKQLYAEINKNINSLKNLKSASGKSDSLRAVVEHGVDHAEIYTHVRKIIVEVAQTVQTVLLPHLLPGRFDGSLLGSLTLTGFQTELRTLQEKRKEAGREIPEAVAISGRTVRLNLRRAKEAIDDSISNVLMAMVGELRKQSSGKLSEISSLVNKALQRLSVVDMHSVADLSSVQSEAAKMQGDLPMLQLEITRIEEVNAVIKQAGLDSLFIEPTVTAFEELRSKLLSFSDFAEELKTELKSKLVDRVKELKNRFLQFEARYKAARPEVKTADSLERICETRKEAAMWRTEWLELLKTGDSVTGDCKAFGVKTETDDGEVDRVKTRFTRTFAGFELLDGFATELGDFTKLQWLDMRTKLYLVGELSDRWQTQLKQQLAADSAFAKEETFLYVTRFLGNLRDAQGGLKAMLGEAFEKEHWRSLYALVGLDKTVPVAELTFASIANCLSRVSERAAELQELAARAVGEVALRDAVAEANAWLETCEFTTTSVTCADKETVEVVKSWKEILAGLTDQQALMGSLQSSKYFAGFKDQADQIVGKLAGVDEAVQGLMRLQRRWTYLEPVLGRLTGSSSLMTERDRFLKIDREVRGIFRQLSQSKRVATVSGGVHSAKLQSLNAQLERTQKALAAYLESKRSAFPRLYFLGDEDLLEILSGDVAAANAHLRKIFQGIHAVKVETHQAVAMLSALGEEVRFLNPISLMAGSEPKPLEVWLGELTAAMVETLKRSLVDSGVLEDQLCVQVASLKEHIDFTSEAELAIAKNQLDTVLEKQKQKLAKAVSRPRHTALQEERAKTLILETIKRISVTESLVEGRVASAADWTWTRQLRFYAKGEVSVKLFEATQSYGWEYQGNQPRLVQTPLTDRCYLTLLHGMHLGYGGNPYGPAGTGKTESVRALSLLLGRQCLVFNCDEGIDYFTMARIFTGLVQSGSYGCFDELNRCLESEMSAIATLIDAIQTGLRAKSPDVTLASVTVPLHKNAAVFITLNPAIKGYGGRRKLPANLKSLFRPISMSAPDNELVSEVTLISDGFKAETSRVLARKIVLVFGVAADVLSHQKHYDWGLRALKSTLLVAGRLKKEHPRDDETQLLMHAIRLSLLSKLTERDAGLLDDLLGDVFGKSALEQVRMRTQQDEAKRAKLVAELQRRNLSVLDDQLAKIDQLEELARQRMGVLICGPALSGKSVLWQTLAAVRGNDQVQVIHPKAVSKHELLGYVDAETRDWSDGILAAAARRVMRTPESTHNWIILDSTPDPDYIESLNSTLDDNRLMSLPNGERIKFGANINFLVETDSLEFASPATVSRVGMIFVAEGSVAVAHLVRRCADRLGLTVAVADVLLTTIELAISALDLSRDLAVSLPAAAVANSALALVEFVQKQKQEVSADLAAVSVAVGICACVKPEARSRVMDVLSRTRPELRCSDGLALGLRLPLEVDRDDLTTIPTSHCLRHAAVTAAWMSVGRGVYLVGAGGSGKKAILRRATAAVQGSLHAISCDSTTTATALLARVRVLCRAQMGGGGRVFKPKGGMGASGLLLMVLDDVHVCEQDKYRSQSAVNAFRQLITVGGFYDADLEWAAVDGLRFAVTAKTEVSSRRAMANASVLAVEALGHEDLSTLFGSVTTRDKAAKQSVDSLLSLVGSQRMAVRLAWETLTFSCAAGEAFDAGLLQSDLACAQVRSAAVTPQTAFFSRVAGLTVLNPAKYKELLDESNRLTDRMNGLETTRSVDVGLIGVYQALEAAMAKTGGHLLLSGPSGSGRRTAVRSLALALKWRFISAPVLRDSRAFVKFLKQTVAAAVEEKQTCVVYLETGLLTAEQLSVISGLMCGDGGAVWRTVEEIEAAGAMLEASTKTPAETLSQLGRLVQKHIRLVSVVTTESDAGLGACDTLVEAFPGFERSRMIDFSVAADVREILKKTLGELSLPATHPEKVARFARDVLSEKQPRRARQVAELFKAVYAKQVSRGQERRATLAKGVAKLDEVHAVVNKLQGEATSQQAELSVKQAGAKTALERVREAMGEAERYRADVEVLEKESKAEEAAAVDDKVKIESEMAGIQPALDEARAAVSSIKQEHLNELKALAKPPEAVQDVLVGVVMALGGQSGDSTWAEVKKQLSGTSSFVTRVLNFDARAISARLRHELERYVSANANSFEEAVIRRASLAAAPLAGWLKANLRYASVIERIAPIENRYAAVRASLEAAARRISDCREKRAAVEKRVEELQSEFARKTGEAEAVKAKLGLVAENLKKASGLLEKLGGEKTRWQTQLSTMEKEAANADLASIGVAAYAVLLAEDFETARAEKLKLWSSSLLGVDLEISGKSLEVSPGISRGSGAAITECLDAGLFPLIVDSSGAAVLWLSAVWKFETVAATDARFLNTLELAYRFGKRLVVTTNSADVPAVLEPCLRREIVGSGRALVALGDKMVDFNRDFRLAIVSTELSTFARLKEPFKSLLVRVNLAVTAESLEAQLLSRAIQFERPDLETRRATLAASQLAKTSELQQVEEQLLGDLAAASGNILENAGLLESLTAAKSAAEVITKALEEGRGLERELETQREVFKQLASQGARFFLLLQSLATVNHSYRFGVGEFQAIFDASIKQARATKERPVSVLSRRTLQCGVQALLKEDRHLFALLLCRVLENSPISAADWDAFLGRSSASVDASSFAAVVRAARGDRPETGVAEVEKFLTGTLGVETVLGMRPSYEESGRALLFFTAADSDAASECRRLAESRGLSLVSVALGSVAGAEKQTLQTLQTRGGEASERQALLISNLHLASDAFLENLTQALEETPFGAVFMSAELSTRVLPSALLEKATKVAWEATPGFKRNVLRCLDVVSESSFAFFVASATKAQSLAALLALHAALNERRRFSPQGWRRGNYEFTAADFQAALESLRMLLSASGVGGSGQTGVAPALQGVLKEAVYGVKLDCEQDARIFEELMRRCFGGSTPQIPAPDVGDSLTKYKSAVEQKLDETKDLEIVGLAKTASAAMDSLATQELVRRLAGHHQASVEAGVHVWREVKQFWGERADLLARLGRANVARTSDESSSTTWRQFLESELALARGLCEAVEAAVREENEAVKRLVADGRAPAEWEWKFSPQDPLDLLHALAKKAEAVVRLAAHAGEPSVVRLGNFFRPDVFVQSLRQRAARAQGTTLEKLTLASEVGETSRKLPLAVGVEDLKLEGAVFDAKYGTLRDARDAAVRSAFPVVYLAWREKDDSLDALGGCVKVPVYADWRREHAVLEISMAADDARTRTLNAVALFVDN